MSEKVSWICYSCGRQSPALRGCLEMAELAAAGIEDGGDLVSP
jgi:hypothetical protein